MHWDYIAYDEQLVQCIRVALHMISIVVQYIGIAMLVMCTAVQCIGIALLKISIVVQCNRNKLAM